MTTELFLYIKEYINTYVPVIVPGGDEFMGLLLYDEYTDSWFVRVERARYPIAVVTFKDCIIYQ